METNLIKYIKKMYGTSNKNNRIDKNIGKIVTSIQKLKEIKKLELKK
jgi:hypothetical protein